MRRCRIPGDDIISFTTCTKTGYVVEGICILRNTIHACIMMLTRTLPSVVRQRTRSSSGGQTKHQRAHKGNILVSLQVSE